MKRLLDDLYSKLNRLEYLSPDPLELVHEYSRRDDRELVGLVASTLSYGRVAQILSSARGVLDGLGDRPARFVADEQPRNVRRAAAKVRHRFTSPAELGDLLVGAGRVMREHGSLESCFLSHFRRGDETTAPALEGFVRELGRAAGARPASLLPLPERGSACKRLHLYLRWMVRRDAVDPGVWTKVDPARLIVPLDTHMHRIARRLRLTTRSQADLRTALDVTRSLREFAPHDPVRYDFALTRIGIRPDCRDMLDASCASV